MGPVINWISRSVHVPVVSLSQSAVSVSPILTTVVESGDVGVTAAREGVTSARRAKTAVEVSIVNREKWSKG